MNVPKAPVNFHSAGVVAATTVQLEGRVKLLHLHFMLHFFTCCRALVPGGQTEECCWVPEAWMGPDHFISAHTCSAAGETARNGNGFLPVLCSVTGLALSAFLRARVGHRRPPHPGRWEAVRASSRSMIACCQLTRDPS